MACTLMNRDACTPEQEQVWLKYFPDNKCAYCGQEATHLDHLHPMIRDNEPTGFGTDPGNLVPRCKNCNTPKGNMAWADFMRSSKCKHMEKPDKTLQESIDELIQNISDFQREMPARFTRIEPTMKQLWKELWCNLEQLLKQTQDELMDMKRQLYGNSASGNQTGTTTPKSGSSGAASESMSPNEARVFNALRDIIDASKMLPSTLHDLQSSDFAKKHFKLSTFPVLIKETNFTLSGWERKRFYQKILQINGEAYLVCSQMRTPSIDLFETWANTL
jgi:hypothetical protein